MAFCACPMMPHWDKVKQETVLYDIFINTIKKILQLPLTMQWLGSLHWFQPYQCSLLKPAFPPHDDRLGNKIQALCEARINWQS